MTVLESQNTTNISNGFHDGFGDETFGNQSQSSPLHVHAFNGNKKLLQDALQSKEYGVDDIDSTGRTPLIYSVLVEQIDCFNLLLKHGADIDKPDTDGRTCLHWAAYQGNHKLVKLVLSKCKNRTSRDKEGQTPLHLAISHDNLRVMQIILKHLNEHEVDATDNRGMTALSWSVHYERIEHVELLLRYGSDVHVLDNERRGILHWTSQNKDPVLIKRLLEKGCKGLGFPDQKGRTVLHMAVGQGNQAIIEYLLTISDIPVNQTDEIQRTPLHWAAVLGHTSIVELLLNSGADYSLADNNGVRPLHYAVQNNHRDVVATMIRTGRVTDEPDKDQRTALMWAALKGHMNVLKVLLEGKNVNINAVDINKQTALHMSCQTGNLECVQLLIQHKADVNMMDQQQHTPLFYACASGHGQIVTKLLQQDDQRNLHQCDLEGRTPLHYSAMVDRREIVNNLLQHGLDPNAQDNSGCPPLHIAAYGGNVHCMNVLLENNAQVNMQDNSGSTALHLACRSGNLDAVKLLVSRYRANMNIFDGSEEKLTCLDYAILNDHQDVSFFLTENGANTISTLHDLSLKIQTNWRGYSARKRYAELKRKMNISTSIPKRRLTNLTTTSLGNNTLKVGTLPPVSPTHAVLPHKANSHIGIPTARYRSNTQVSHTSNVSDSRQGPKFIEGNAANPFSLNRVARVKSPGTEIRVPNSSRSKSSTGVMSPYRPNNLPPPKRMNSTGKMGSRNHIFSLSSKSSTTSSSDYFFAKNEKTFIEPKKPPTIHIQPQQPAHDHLIQYEGRTSARAAPSEKTSVQYRPVPFISLPNDEQPDIMHEDVQPSPPRRFLPQPPSRPSTGASNSNIEDGGNKPWHIYRRDQKRIHIIRMKTEAAIKIQSVFRGYRARRVVRFLNRNDKQYLDVNRSELSDFSTLGSESDSYLSMDSEIPDDDTLREIAALVIQVAWRQYVKLKLLNRASSQEHMIPESNANDEQLNSSTVDFKKRKLSQSDLGSSITSSNGSEVHSKDVMSRTKSKTIESQSIDLISQDVIGTEVSSKRKSSKRRNKAKLAPSSSFPLMENIYRENVRVKRTKKLSIKSRLLQRQSTVTETDFKTRTLSLRDGIEQFSKEDIEALKNGKPKLFLNSKE